MALMTLGMAEYRSGRYPQAAETLRAITSDDAQIGGTSGFYRVMSLFQQDKKTESLELFTATEAKMKPLPADDQNPLADLGSIDGLNFRQADGSTGDLILWLAYKEAKLLLQIPATEAKP